MSEQNDPNKNPHSVNRFDNSEIITDEEELARIAQKLIDEGRMPSLEDFQKAMQEAYRQTTQEHPEWFEQTHKDSIK